MTIDLFIGGADGLALVGLGLLVLEFFLPTKGLLAVCGVAFFMAGTYVMTGNPDPTQRLGLGAMVALNAGLLLVVGSVVYVMLRGYCAPDNLRADLVGQTARVIEWHDGHGRVELDGVTWNAASDACFITGDTVRVARLDGLVLYLEKIGET